MRTIVLAGGLTSLWMLSAAAVAEEAKVPALSIKRQIVACMIKSMTANRTLSYNDAERICKESVTARNQPAVTAKRALTADAAVAPALKTP